MARIQKAKLERKPTRIETLLIRRDLRPTSQQYMAHYTIIKFAPVRRLTFLQEMTINSRELRTNYESIVRCMFSGYSRLHTPAGLL